MDTLFTHSHSSSPMNTRTEIDADISMLMDTSRDFEAPSDAVVTWVASQSPNPALQALMKEAEREKKTRPSTPVHEPMSWTYPLTSTPSSTSLSTSVASPWRASSHNSVDASYLLSRSSNSSSSSLALPASEPSISRRAKPLSAASRKSLASSTSSANQPIHDSARPRSSSHSTTISTPSTSKPKYIPQEEEPEAMAFIELLKDVSKRLDQNSEKKQRLAARAKDKERERSLGRVGIDHRTGLGTDRLSARPLTKTSSASAIYPVGSSMRPGERTSDTPRSTCRPEPRGRVLEKKASLDAPGMDLISGKFIPASLSSTHLNCDLKLTPAGVPKTTAAHKASKLEPPPDDGESMMQGIIDLTATDVAWKRMSRTDVATYTQVDGDDMHSDAAMDVSFLQEELPSQYRVPAPKLKPHPRQPNTASRPPAPTQHTRAGPPPLGMRRAPQLQTAQYGLSQGSKGVTVPRFRPPLLANAGGTTNKSGSGSRSASTSLKVIPRGEGTKVAVAKTTSRGNQDADSSFDVSFGVDADALEEAMKAYD